MADINRVVIGGRLAKQPEIRFFPDGGSVCMFVVASNRKVKGRDEVGYFDVSAFGKLGESVSEYLRKGSTLIVDGKLKQRRWEQDGKTHSRIEVVADAIQFLSYKPEAETTTIHNGASEGDGQGDGAHPF